jgi:hypothetical protein
VECLKPSPFFSTIYVYENPLERIPKSVRAEREGDEACGVSIRNTDNGDKRTFSCDFLLRNAVTWTKLSYRHQKEEAHSLIRRNGTRVVAGE